MKVTCGNCHEELEIPPCLPATMLLCQHCKEWTQVPISSAEQWFVARNKQKLGPFSLEQLRQQASTGKLQPDDMLLKEGTAKWIAASVVGNLFPPASAQLPPAPIANSMQAPARRKKAATSIAVIAVQATAFTALLIGIPIIIISVWGASKSSQNIEEIKAGGKGSLDALNETRKREGYSGDTKPLNKDKVVADRDKTITPPAFHEPTTEPTNIAMPKQGAVDPSITLSTKKEIEDFADNTSSYKGKTITVEATYYDMKLLREGLPDTRDFGGHSSHFEATISLKIKIESDDGLPNAEFGDKLVITFWCGEGDFTKGNKLISAKRK